MKPGEKYIIEIDRVVKGPRDIAFVKGFNALVFDQYGLDHLERYDDKKVRNTIDDAIDAAYKRGWNECAEKIQNIKDAAYQNGLDDAWKLARRLCMNPRDGGMSAEDLEDAFGSLIPTIFRACSYPQAFQKVKAWEKKKAEIHVGDEVKFKLSDVTFVVTRVGGELISGFSTDGNQFCDKRSCNWEKTGRHFDLTKLFQFMGRKDDGPEL